MPSSLLLQLWMGLSSLLLTLSRLTAFLDPFLESSVGGDEGLHALSDTAHRAVLADTKPLTDSI